VEKLAVLERLTKETTVETLLLLELTIQLHSKTVAVAAQVRQETLQAETVATELLQALQERQLLALAVAVVSLLSWHLLAELVEAETAVLVTQETHR
jgi:hypothetical protein